MSTKFFTNEEQNTLLNKIESVFKYKNIYFLDALVSYFRASGYFQIREFVENVQEIRILVKAYPHMNEEVEPDFERKIVRVKTINPEIIITESFNK